MKPLLLIALLFAVNCHAQLTTVAAAKKKTPVATVGGGGTWPPSGFTNFWDPSGSGFSTNAGVVTLVDSVSGVNLTNGSSASSPVAGAGLNGYRTLAFNLKRLQNSGVYTTAQAFEIDVVVAVTNKGAVAVLISGTNGIGSLANGDAMQINAGTGLGTSPITTIATNKFQVYRLIFNGGSSSIWTNLTQQITGAAGSSGIAGVVVGQNLAGSFGGLFDLAAFGVRTPPWASNEWASVFSEITNRYAFNP